MVGDLFIKNEKRIPTFEKNKKEIRKNRDKILKMADFIVPGHDKIFKGKRLGRKII